MGSQSDDLAPDEVNAILGRIADLIGAATRRLGPDDLRARVEYCRATGEHGATVHRDGDDISVWWGGKLLVAMDREQLAAVVPDDPSGLGS